MKEKTIPGNSEITLKLQAGNVDYIMKMLETLPLPRYESDPVYLPIRKQYDEQFEKINKKLQLVNKDKVI